MFTIGSGKLCAFILFFDLCALISVQARPYIHYVMFRLVLKMYEVNFKKRKGNGEKK